MSSGLFGGFFGKKDKNAAQPPAPPSPKSPPSPPAAPAAPKPQAGLTPVPARASIGAATTQPMVLPKGGLKPAKPSLISGGKSTQRIVLPGRGGDTAPTGSVSSMHSGNLSLPLAMIVRFLPDEVRAISMQEFESSPNADQDVSLPMGLILPQLPSGKVEISVQELVAAIPRAYVRSPEEIAPYLATPVQLPLMDVVMRIPPDLLALRPDQKEVDSAVVNMADPFTEELLREQARKAEEERRATQQVPAPPMPPVAPAEPEPVAEAATLPESMPTVPLPRPVAGKPPVLPPAPAAERPPSISLPRPSSIPLPKPAAASAPLPPPPPVAPPAAPDGGMSEDMKKLLAAAEAELGDAPAETPAPVEEPVAAVEEPAAQPSAPEDPAPVVAEEPAPVVEAVIPPPPPAPVVAPPPVVPPPPVTAVPHRPPTLSRNAVTAPLQPAQPTASAPLPPPPPPPVAPPAAPKAVSAPLPPPPPIPRPTTPPPPVAAPTVPPPAPVMAAPAPVKAPEAVSVPTAEPVSASAASRKVDLNACTVEQLAGSGCPKLLAETIVKFRNSHGPFRRLEDLLKVPGITKATYALLTGREVTTADVLGTLNDVLGFPPDQEVSLKDITDRISCWPDVTGCVLGQASGLPLVGSVPDGLEKSAIMAFAPRLLAGLNSSFKEFSGRETNELIIPTKGTSYHIFRNDNLFLVILSRRTQLPRRFIKVARYVLASIDASRNQ